MSDEDKQSPPPLDDGEDEEDVQDEEEIQTNVQFSSSSALPASPSKVRKPGETAATPSNT
jgi:hypothetical protein